MIKKKKGLTLKTTLAMILGLIGALLLLYLVVRFMYFQDSEMKAALKSLNKLEYSIKQAKITGQHNAEILSPSGWYISNWPTGSSFLRPKNCNKRNFCVCFCYGLTVSDCDRYSQCLQLDEPVKTYYLTDYPSIYDRRLSGLKDLFGYDTRNVPIPIENPPVLITVTYEKNKGYEIIYPQK